MIAYNSSTFRLIHRESSVHMVGWESQQYRPKNCSIVILTFFKVVCFSDIDKYERHELELREALAGGGGDGEEVPQLVDLVVYVISP